MGAPITFPDAAAIWNQRYAGSEFLFGTEPNAWLREHVGALSKGGRILSVDDGEGRNSVWLAKQGFEVDAFDISERAVEKAREYARMFEQIVRSLKPGGVLILQGYSPKPKQRDFKSDGSLRRTGFFNGSH